MAFTARRNAHA